LFDLVIVGACKPAFLTDHRLSLFRVCAKTGLLSNVENKLSLEHDNFDSVATSIVPSRETDKDRQNTFQGGNWQDLHRLLNVKGNNILFVGDHMLADILRSKKSLGLANWIVIFVQLVCYYWVIVFG
jgi:5'-nucleotidase